MALKKFNLLNVFLLFLFLVAYENGFVILRWNYFEKAKEEAEQMKAEDEKLYSEAMELAKLRIQD